MRYRAMIALLLILFLASVASAASYKSGSSSGTDSDENENNDVKWQDSNTADNTFPNQEVEKFAKKLINGSIPDLPNGNPTVVLLIHDNNDVVTWEQILNDFVQEDNFFENDNMKEQYNAENDAYAAGQDTYFPAHTAVVQRLANFAAEQIDLSGDARFYIISGTMRAENAGREYNVPFAGLISRKSSELGRIVYPSVEKIGLSDDVDAPFTPGQFDHYEWYRANTD